MKDYRLNFLFRLDKDELNHLIFDRDGNVKINAYYNYDMNSNTDMNTIFKEITKFIDTYNIDNRVCKLIARDSQKKSLYDDTVFMKSLYQKNVYYIDNVKNVYYMDPHLALDLLKHEINYFRIEPRIYSWNKEETIRTINDIEKNDINVLSEMIKDDITKDNNSDIPDLIYLKFEKSANGKWDIKLYDDKDKSKITYLVKYDMDKYSEYDILRFLRPLIDNSEITYHQVNDVYFFLTLPILVYQDLFESLIDLYDERIMVLKSDSKTNFSEMIKLNNYKEYIIIELNRLNTLVNACQAFDKDFRSSSSF